MTATQNNTGKKRFKTGNIILAVSLTLNLFFAAFALGSTALADAAGAVRPLAQLKQVWVSLTPEGKDIIREALLARKDTMKANAAKGREFQLEFAAIIDGDAVDETALDALVAKKENFAGSLREDLRGTMRTTLSALPAVDRHIIAEAIRNHEPKANMFIDKLMTKLQNADSKLPATTEETPVE
ncbi:MAG: hypothetical protein HND56_00910 [Pseudomonadota bacterium]|jgi:uncharacterized membrane protein|nr:hypothetical protein [Pseudomonadota bacterium]QKK04327.1 MAG: hypothetical protein HND56_00910 [Pseudomonadota bacterium]